MAAASAGKAWNSWQSPTTCTLSAARFIARVTALIGLVTFSSQAPGQCRSMSSTTSAATGTVRRAAEMPAGPTVMETGWRMP